MATDENKEAIAAAMAALDLFMNSLNAHDNDGVRASFNFPHARHASGRWHVGEKPEDMVNKLLTDPASAGDWHRSAWDKREIVQAGPDKVHFSVQFSRYRKDGSYIASFESLWIVTLQDGKWGVAGRSSWAA